MVAERSVSVDKKFKVSFRLHRPGTDRLDRAGIADGTRRSAQDSRRSMGNITSDLLSDGMGDKPMAGALLRITVAGRPAFFLKQWQAHRVADAGNHGLR